MAYRVHLENFEGPLDLLLYFIQRDQIDIYDIPIAHITAEYLSYLDLMESLNLSVAGEFILLAATLMHIKARMLLPRAEPLEDEPIEDPRQELVQQLIEYQRFKQASEELSQLAERRRAHFPVGGTIDVAGDSMGPGDYLQDVTLFQLVAVFKEVIDRLPSTEPLQISAEPIRLDDRIRIINQAIGVTSRITFLKILQGVGQIQEVIVTFLAILEMMRRGVIVVRQSATFAEIYLQKTEPER